MHHQYFTLKTAAILGILSLASGLFAIAYAQSASDIAANVTALIVAIGSVMGSIAAIATSVVAIIKSTTGNKIISNKANADVNAISQNLIATDLWIKENQTNMTRIVSTIANLSPETKMSLEANGMNIQALTNELNGLNSDLQAWHAMLPVNRPAANP